MRPSGVEKNALKPWLKEQWCIPPEANAEFVAAMEEVLTVYTQPEDPDAPLVCFDESNKQLVKETRTPLPMEPGQLLREDYEYERNGVANLFLFYEPLTGWRHVEVTDRRTKVDFAHQMKWLVDERHPHARRIKVVMDNLNTHSFGSLYEAFSPEEARRIRERLVFFYTPKHGSWLNMAEIEFSVLSSQCLDRRIGEISFLRQEVEAWEEARNRKGNRIDWRFTTEDARIRLKHLYPSLTE